MHKQSQKYYKKAAKGPGNEVDFLRFGWELIGGVYNRGATVYNNNINIRKHLISEFIPISSSEQACVIKISKCICAVRELTRDI